ncbi:FAD dependent oxidoreductase [Tricladium varicosporioides]|nr:FAD dependent oxidoreductase [Hymenoscyphus varicosporioides]
MTFPTSARSRNKSNSILIVGAGVFGLGAASELAARGYQNITVVDRFPPPVPDGSSVDISRVIRADYADPIYARMASEAQALWRTEYNEHYHQSGLVILSETPKHPYIEGCIKALKDLNQPTNHIANGNDAKKKYPALTGDMSGTYGYINTAGGWANAAAAIKQLAFKCAQRGVSFISGPRGTVTQLQRRGNKITGIEVLSGPAITADHIILATGAWTSRLVPTYESVISTGQPVGFLQLTQDEADRLRKMPVCINLSSGFFVFPPTLDTNILKVARHGFGYENPVNVKYPPAQKNMPALQKTVSGPRRDINGARASSIPADADAALRRGIRQLLPEFADRLWGMTRLCWYTDTPKGDFIITDHPNVEGLFLATGGSGHAFKFLPVLGRYIVDVFEGVASQEMTDKWSYANAMNGSPSEGDGSRGGPKRRSLSVAERANL